MKYLSIDTETTSLNPLTGQILSIGIIAENTILSSLIFKDIPKFYCIILHDEIHGEPFALNMNKGLIESISKFKNLKTKEEKDELEYDLGCVFLKPEEVAEKIKDFLVKYGFGVEGFNVLNTAGKNLGTFDKPFLENQIPFWGSFFRIHQRVLDPSILFVDWTKDEKLPDLLTCKKRVGLDEVVQHQALIDAWDVVELLRIKY